MCSIVFGMKVLIWGDADGLFYVLSPVSNAPITVEDRIIGEFSHLRGVSGYCVSTINMFNYSSCTFSTCSIFFNVCVRVSLCHSMASDVVNGISSTGYFTVTIQSTQI